MRRSRTTIGIVDSVIIFTMFMSHNEAVLQ